MFSLLGIVVSLAVGVAFVVVLLIVRRLIVGPEAEGLFTLFGIAFFLIGITLFGIGLLGEYVGRIYQQVRQRPRYLIEAVLERRPDERTRDDAHSDAARLRNRTSHRRRLRLPQRRLRAACKVLLAHGVDVALVVTHEDIPTENIWFGSVADLARALRTSRSHHAGRPQHARSIARIRGAAAGLLVLVLLSA
jgi:hypothetical protein